jgi:hypothetical protein
MKDREVTLKLNSRPLKLAYLVRNTADLLDAILLYTHLWGGGANCILPLPDNIEEMIHLEEALRIVDPDYILIPIGEDHLPDLEKKLPARQRPISHHAIQKHIIGEDFYRFPTGDLNHIIPVIDAYFPDGISSNNSLIGVVESSSDITNALHFGLPTRGYHDYLSSRCGAKTFRTPLTIQEEIQLKLVFSQRTSLRDFTLAKIKRNWDGFNTDAFETNDPETLCLFLGND